MHKDEMHTELQLRYMNGRDHMGDLGTDGRIIVKSILKELCLKIWAGFV
jgi:hypothetical protein